MFNEIQQEMGEYRFWRSGVGVAQPIFLPDQVAKILAKADSATAHLSAESSWARAYYQYAKDGFDRAALISRQTYGERVNALLAQAICDAETAISHLSQTRT